MVRPHANLIDPSWSVYTDGSMLDGPTALLRRTGWSFAALDADGCVQASALGVPPPWISTIFGAETWASLQAVTHASGFAILRIEHKATVDLLFAER